MKKIRARIGYFWEAGGGFIMLVLLIPAFFVSMWLGLVLLCVFVAIYAVAWCDNDLRYRGQTHCETDPEDMPDFLRIPQDRE